MNKRENGILTEMAAMQAVLRTDVKYIREKIRENTEHLKEMNGNFDLTDQKVAILENTLKNHLQTHKSDLIKMTAIIGAIATIVSAIISVVL